MNDDATSEQSQDPHMAATEWAAKAAELKAAAKAAAEDMARDPDLQQEVGKQNNLIYGALIAIGLVWVQPFLAIGVPSTAARVCVIAFSVAIPLLAGLILLGRQEEFRRRLATSWLVTTTRSVAQLAAIVGVVAGFWHIDWIAGVTLLATGCIALAAHSAGWANLEMDNTLKKLMSYTTKSKDS